MRIWKALFPFLISFGLVAWLVTRVSPAALIRAAEELNWHALVPTTISMVLGLYLWDAVCLRSLFTTEGAPLNYRQALHARGISYLASAINYELGQGILAWDIAKSQRTGVVSCLSRMLILAYHDLLVLFGLALLGSIMVLQPRIAGLRTFAATGLLVLLLLPVIANMLPVTVLQRTVPARWRSQVDGWSLSQSFTLALLRIAYYLILVVYAAMALHFCRIHVNSLVVLSTIPMVLLADGLPSVSGLGTRDTALQLLLKPDRPELMAAMSLLWSSGLIIGRLGIGLAHMWTPRVLALLRAH